MQATGRRFEVLRLNKIWGYYVIRALSEVGDNWLMMTSQSARIKLGEAFVYSLMFSGVVLDTWP